MSFGHPQGFLRKCLRLSIHGQVLSTVFDGGDVFTLRLDDSLDQKLERQIIHPSQVASVAWVWVASELVDVAGNAANYPSLVIHQMVEGLFGSTIRLR